MNPDHKAIHSKIAPEAIGPYSQAIHTGSLIYCSGQIALDNKGTLHNSDITAETTMVMENIKAVLHEAGATMDHVVKTTIFLTNLDDFEEVGKVYAGYFQQPYPARSTIQVAALPKGARVEIEATAYVIS
ncbi:MAG: RidA family protein [Proteobacteria bacterium]|nr:RidA family protein [Pseudomonadota bacterium]